MSIRKTVQQIVIGISALAISSAATAADIPQWWYSRGLVNPQGVANDYAPANIGQLKNAAYQTWVEVTNRLAQVATNGNYVQRSGDTMTGSLTCSNLISLGTITARQAQYTAQNSWTITNKTAADGTFKVTTDGKLMLWFGTNWFVFSPTATVIPPPSTDSPSGLVLVSGGTLPNIGNGVITVSNFYIGQTEVTWGEWRAVRAWASTHGYDIGSVGSGCADDHPVHSVNWYDVVKWCNARSEKEGRALVYTASGGIYRSGVSDSVNINASANGYRLPSNAEWEFAARGGTHSYGYTYSGGNAIDTVAWHEGNSHGAACDLSGGLGTWPVGQKLANELELYDMSGNLNEWCFEGGTTGYRVIRGGGWLFGGCEVSSRGGYMTSARSYIIGFRLVVSIGP